MLNLKTKKMEKNNKLIAEFMELETPDGVYFEYLTKDGERSKLTHFILLEYHLSWDWLMPVIDKCYQEHMSKHIADAVMTCNIDKAYQVVVEFIKDQNN